MKKPLVLGVASATLVGLVSAATTQIPVGWIDPVTNTTVETAALWNDSANWTLGEPPFSSGNVRAHAVKIAEPSEGYRFIKLTGWAHPYNVQVTNWVNGTLPKIVIFEDTNGALRYMCHSGDAGVADRGFWMYAPYNFSNAQSFGNVQMCSFLYGGNAARTFRGGLTLRLDKYASNGKYAQLVNRSTNGFATHHLAGAGTFRIYSPESSATNNVSTWLLTAGSKIIRRVSAVRHAITTGGVVTGAGVPSVATGATRDTHVDRIFPDDSVELTAEATKSGEVELTFAAHAPSVLQQFDSVSWTAYNEFLISLNKYRPEDSLTVEFNQLRPFNAYNETANGRVLGSANDGWVYESHGQYRFDTEAGFSPGRVILHTVGKVDNGVSTQDYSPVYLGNCDILFSDSKFAYGPGFSCPSQFVYSVENTVADLTVTGAMTATVNYMRGWRGTVNKNGTGTLDVGISFKDQESLSSKGGNYGKTQTDNASLGRMNVREGRLNLLFTRTASNATIPAFSVSEGATRSFPAISGSDRVVNTYGMTLENGATLVFKPRLASDTGEVGITPLNLVSKKLIDPLAEVTVSLEGDLAHALIPGRECKLVNNISNENGSAVNWKLARGTAGPSIKAKFAVHDNALWMALEQSGMMLLVR